MFVRAYRGLQEFQGRRRRSAPGSIGSRVNVCLNKVGGEDAASRSARSAAGGERRADRVAGRERAARRCCAASAPAQVRAAIARLPQKQRATLILRVYHELPHEEIAGILGSSVGAVKANFFHALDNLKKLLREAGIDR